MTTTNQTYIPPSEADRISELERQVELISKQMELVRGNERDLYQIVNACLEMIKTISNAIGLAKMNN